jgi:hypothetical protein
LRASRQISLELIWFEIKWLVQVSQEISILCYVVIAARFFRAAVDRRKGLVFSLVLLAALLATGANVVSLAGYLAWKGEHSSCPGQIASGKPILDRSAESALKEMAREVQADQTVKNNYLFDVS